MIRLCFPLPLPSSPSSSHSVLKPLRGAEQPSVSFLSLSWQIPSHAVAQNHTVPYLAVPEHRRVRWLSPGPQQGVSRTAFLSHSSKGKSTPSSFRLRGAARAPVSGSRPPSYPAVPGASPAAISLVLSSAFRSCLEGAAWLGCIPQEAKVTSPGRVPGLSPITEIGLDVFGEPRLWGSTCHHRALCQQGTGGCVGGPQTRGTQSVGTQAGQGAGPTMGGEGVRVCSRLARSSLRGSPTGQPSL